MSDEKENNPTPLSREEQAVAEELLAEIRRGLSLLLADSNTPQVFKDAFLEHTDEG